MVSSRNNPAFVGQYIGKFPPQVQESLRILRAVIQKAAPGAEEGSGYGVPAYYLNGPLVYFAAFKNHIGFYPTSEGIAAFSEELKTV